MSAADTSLAGQVAVVTGGGGGIGRAIAIAYAQAGANVVVGDIVHERCDEVVARVRALGREALGVPVDVTSTEQIRGLIDQAAERFDRIDILVNNAGGVAPKPFLEQSERSWRKLIDLNFVSMLTATSAAAPVMIRGARGGSIVNVASIEASRAAPNFAVYGACKAAMLNFTRSMALEFSAHAIRVNAIAPDYTVTPGLRGNVGGPVDETKWLQPTPAQNDASARRIPLGRPGIDSECANVALFLASKMSAYVTGAVIPVDGGTWASSGWVRNRAGNWTLMGDV